MLHFKHLEKKNKLNTKPAELNKNKSWNQLNREQKHSMKNKQNKQLVLWKDK
jgi:hypothetical protein